MFITDSIISEKHRKRSHIRERNPYNKKVEDKIEELKRKMIINYYMNGGI